MPGPRRRQGQRLRKRLASLAAAVLLALVLRALVIQAYRIPSGSMEETLLPGDYLMAAKFIYGVREPFGRRRLLPALRSPRVGEVLVFGYPVDGRDFIKRCVATSGDTVAVWKGELYVNGCRMDASRGGQRTSRGSDSAGPAFKPWSAFYQQAWEQRKFLQLSWVRDEFGPVVVPPGHLFMMGDNRNNSMDSRFWGPLPVEEIRGKALFIYWSWDGEVRAPAWQFWRRVRWSRIGRAIK